MTLRARRLENEWHFLHRLEEHNPELIEIFGREQSCGEDRFYLRVRETSAVQLPAPERTVVTEHDVKLQFQDYFPSVPIEAFLTKPVFHPNVHPDNGFVCLWDKFSPGDSVIETLRQLQRVISWELYNAQADHLMQPEALLEERMWAALPYRRIEIPPDLREERSYIRRPAGLRRIRLS